MKKYDFKGIIKKEDVARTVNGLQLSYLVWGGLKKHNLKTWEALKVWRKAMKASVTDTLTKKLGEDAMANLRIITTLYGVNVYTHKLATYKNKPLYAIVASVLNACYGDMLYTGQHIEKGAKRTPDFLKLSYITPTLKPNGEWHKQSTKTEVLKRY